MTQDKVGIRGWLALAVVLVAELLDGMDGIIAGLGGPSILRDLHGGPSLLQWIAAGYTIAMAAGLLTGGRLGDMFGRPRMFRVGMLGFTAMSLLCACAGAPGILIVARVLQGLFGALMIPQGMAIIAEVFPAGRLSQAFAVMGPAMSLSAILGPIVAGGILKADLLGFGWRVLFAINVPFCALALVGSFLLFPSSRPTPGLRLDWGGAALAGLGMAAIVFPLVQGRELSWPAWTLVMLAAGIAVAAVFVRYQVVRARAGRPTLVAPALLSERRFAGGIVMGLVFTAATTGIGLLQALFFQLGLGMSPLRASFLTWPDALGMMGAFLLVGRLGTKRSTLLIGAVVAAIGFVTMGIPVSVWGTRLNPWLTAPGLLLAGIGSGIVMAPFFDLVIGGVHLDDTGSATGVINAAQQVGGAIGISALGSLFFGLGGTLADPAALTRGFVLALGAGVGLVLLSMAFMLLLPADAPEPVDAMGPDAVAG